MVATSFTTAAGIYARRTYVPLHATLNHYARLFEESNFGIYYINSVICTGATVALALPISFIAAYALIRLRIFGQRWLSGSVLLGYIIPPSILVIPLFVVLGTLSLVNTRTGLVLAYLTRATPFCTWLLMGYLRGIPTEIEDAGKIDGCGCLSLLFRIVLPLALPGIITAGIYTFVVAWGLFLYPAVLITHNLKQVLAIGISTLVCGDAYPWGQVMAAGALACLLPVVIFIMVQKYLVQGLTAGSIK